MLNPSILGFKKGPAFTKSNEEKIDNYWTLTGIPGDIPKKTAVNNVKNFLSEIVSLEIPTSLMCNCNCGYCYIREKWLKNTIVSVSEIQSIVEKGWKHILEFEPKNDTRALTAWGAEPFCNLDTLEYLINFCIDHKADIGLSTNGTILNERVKILLFNMYKQYINLKSDNSYVPTFQISLDGPKHIQDIYRPMYSEQSNYDRVMEFINFINDISSELNINRKLYSLCSTIYLGVNSVEIYKDAVDFFTDITNDTIYSPLLPIRLENSKNFTKHDAELFYDIIKESTEFLIEKSKKTGEAYLDNYASKLFLETSRIDGWPRCSAMNSQLAIDIDGSMYMCHGPITTTKLKPLHCFGNILDGVIDYRRYISVMDSIYADTAFKSICKSCDLSIKCTGNICCSCPPSSMSGNDEPVNFNIHMCNIYKKCFPLWEKQFTQYQKIQQGAK